MKAERILAWVVMLSALSSSRIGRAQTDSPKIPHWAAVVHQLALKTQDPELPRKGSTGVFPPTIPQYLESFDPSGAVETENLAAPTDTSTNPFFQNLGTNGRACATC